MMEVVIVALAATLGNLLMGWDNSTVAGVYFTLYFMHFFFLSDCVVYSDFSVVHVRFLLKVSMPCMDYDNNVFILVL